MNFKSIGNKIAVFFSACWFYVKPVIKTMLSSSATALAESAKITVPQCLEIYRTEGPEAARQKAFEVIKFDLETQGHAIASSAINAAIEAAVAGLK
ncbi:hypothetical protein [Desulforegula conservatrix]|uniref:hypothetical protein n=1 Tax=Desulforegula conservatrix TaxID=153026 RepID=UPI000414FE9D|nr:hypothetical protein [Desulforegula conservatrix]